MVFIKIIIFFFVCLILNNILFNIPIIEGNTSSSDASCERDNTTQINILKQKLNDYDTISKKCITDYNNLQKSFDAQYKKLNAKNNANYSVINKKLPNCHTST